MYMFQNLEISKTCILVQVRLKSVMYLICQVLRAFDDFKMTDTGVAILNINTYSTKFKTIIHQALFNVYFVGINCSPHEFDINRNIEGNYLCDSFKFRLCIFYLGFVTSQSLEMAAPMTVILNIFIAM